MREENEKKKRAWKERRGMGKKGRMEGEREGEEVGGR